MDELLRLTELSVVLELVVVLWFTLTPTASILLTAGSLGFKAICGGTVMLTRVRKLLLWAELLVDLWCTSTTIASILLTAGLLGLSVMCGAVDELRVVSKLAMMVECGLWPGASILLTAGLGTAKETAMGTVTRLYASRLAMFIRMPRKQQVEPKSMQGSSCEPWQQAMRLIS